MQRFHCALSANPAIPDRVDSSMTRHRYVDDLWRQNNDLD